MLLRLPIARTLPSHLVRSIVPAASVTRASQISHSLLRTCAFSTTSTSPEEQKSPTLGPDDLSDLPSSLTSSSSLPQTSTGDASVPWYLQVESPTTQQPHALSERQRLPPLPEHSPDLLEPLLQHLSVQLGIDDLSLLDLRALDPPPALGANLLMIIGTARSEKHLHVSADRLCRWLRSTHQLSPIADGLLGRNELKLKMRRKAKRSRLLGAVGAKSTGEGQVDDGIRTGWVCVHVGNVSGGLLPEHQESQKQAASADKFVGFGSYTPACNIVVQMMTDEKRGDLDLETLWNGILRRSKKAQSEQKPERNSEGLYEDLPEDLDTAPKSTEREVTDPTPATAESSEYTEIYRPASPTPARRSRVAI